MSVRLCTASSNCYFGCMGSAALQGRRGRGQSCTSE